MVSALEALARVEQNDLTAAELPGRLYGAGGLDDSAGLTTDDRKPLDQPGEAALGRRRDRLAVSRWASELE